MKLQYRIGDSVAVKKGVKDPDQRRDIGGWQGRIVGIDESEQAPSVLIEWDSRTMEGMSRSVIEESARDGMDWTRMRLHASQVAPARPRDNPRNVIRTVQRISGKCRLDSPPAQPDRMGSAPDQPDRPVRKRITEQTPDQPFRKRITLQAPDQPITMTWTGELYQLARVHYRLLDRDEVAEAFSKLRCMDFDPDKKRWMWLYHGEARNLEFERPYSKIPKEKHPIVLGSFFSKSQDAMYLDTTSFVRVLKAIVFFDKHLKRSIAEVTDVEVVNRLFSTGRSGLPKHDDLFGKAGAVSESESPLEEIKQTLLTIDDAEERLSVGLHLLEESAKQPLPEVERMPTHFYEDGIRPFENSLKMRTIIAHQHALGNTEYSMYDLIRETVPY